MSIQESLLRLSAAERELVTVTDPAARRHILDQVAAEADSTLPAVSWQAVLEHRYPSGKGQPPDALLGLWLELFTISRSGVGMRTAARQYRRALQDERFARPMQTALRDTELALQQEVQQLELFNAALRYMEMTLDDRGSSTVLFGLMKVNPDKALARFEQEVLNLIAALQQQSPASGSFISAKELADILQAAMGRIPEFNQ